VDLLYRDCEAMVDGEPAGPSEFPSNPDVLRVMVSVDQAKLLVTRVEMVYPENDAPVITLNDALIRLLPGERQEVPVTVFDADGVDQLSIDMQAPCTNGASPFIDLAGTQRVGTVENTSVLVSTSLPGPFIPVEYSCTVTLTATDEFGATDVASFAVEVGSFNDVVNLISNGDFEAGSGSQPDNWYTDVWQTPRTDFVWETEGGLGDSPHVRITNRAGDGRGNVAAYVQDVTGLEPGASYIYSAWVKVDELTPGIEGVGSVYLSLIGTFDGSVPLREPIDWTRVEFQFEASAAEMTLGLRVGQWTNASIGTARFDNVHLRLAQ